MSDSPQRPIGCHCTNHLGAHKRRHPSRAAALTWVLRAASKRDIDGMRFEPYRCPDGNGWHLRTARARKSA